MHETYYIPMFLHNLNEKIDSVHNQFIYGFCLGRNCICEARLYCIMVLKKEDKSGSVIITKMAYKIMLLTISST